MKMFASISAMLIAAMVGGMGIVNRESADTYAASTITATARAPVAPQSAAALYSTHCAKCHGADGRGQTQQGKATGARDFNSARWKARTSVEEAAAAIRDGYEEMPSFKRRLTAAQIQALAEYSKSFPH